MGTGVRIPLSGDDYLEIPEFSLGAFLHLSDLKITLTDEASRSSQHFLGIGIGTTVRLAPITFYLEGLGGARIQPLAAEVDLFGLMTRGNLRAIVLSVSLGGQVGWRF